MLSEVKELAPVLLFAFKRLDKLKHTVAALQNNFLAPQSELFIFSDGARSAEDVAAVIEVRAFLRTITGFGKVNIIESNENKGLAASIIGGVSSVISKYSKVIVLEDDLETTPNFLSYMNQTLNFYRENLRVFSISGYNYPIDVPKDYQPDVYFFPRGSSWGWATWADRWRNIDWSVNDYQTFSKSRYLKRKFNAGGKDLSSMLAKQMAGRIDSWAIRWYYHQFKESQVTVYPVRSKVINKGFDANATHTNTYNRYLSTTDSVFMKSFILPNNVSYNAAIFSSFQRFFSLRVRAWGKLKTYMVRLGLMRNLT